MAAGIFRPDPETMDLLRSQGRLINYPYTRTDEDEKLPLEEIDAFSDAPLEFEELTSMMLDDVSNAQAFAAILNRFSEKYVQVSRMLLKGVSKLVSCCITKEVLIKKGYNFPKITGLTLEPLYRIVSFNFRKVHAAINGEKNNRYAKWAQLLDLEMGWYQLAERMRATDDKIARIRDGRLNVDKLIENAQLCVKKVSPTISGKQPSERSGAVRKASAYPVINSVVRAVTEKAGESNAAHKTDGRTNAGEKEAAESKPYATMKQRKKAERLARKQARAALQSPKTEPFGEQNLLKTAADVRNLITEDERRYPFARDALPDML